MVESILLGYRAVFRITARAIVLVSNSGDKKV